MRTSTKSATLLGSGALLGVVSGVLHPHRVAPNSHRAVFLEYATSRDWVWVHDLQYLSAALVVAGFVVLYHASAAIRPPSALSRIALVSAGVTGSLIAVNMAVDGVALKQAVDAWAAAPEADKAGRFAAAEAVRWTEWGANSLFTIQLGATVLLFGWLLAVEHRRCRVPGLVAVVGGTALVASGLQVGKEGFVPSPLPLVGLACFAVLVLGVAFRLPSPENAAVHPGHRKPQLAH